ncbi:MAG TPA: RloB domain-containing protein [Candidatus Paceibacterota bacterium]
MSRTNPFKKKRRAASRTLLVFGEGMCEEMFLKHIKSLYSYIANIAVTVRKGKGGTAFDVVIDSDKIPGDFDKKVVVLDNDKSTEEMQQARKEANNRGIILIENTPCIEALLLSILESGTEFSSKTSAWCKKEFELMALPPKFA